MAPMVSMAPREASVLGLARGSPGLGSAAARAGRRSAAFARGWAGRPARLGRGCRQAQHAVGAGGRGLGPERETCSSQKPPLRLGSQPAASRDLECRGGSLGRSAVLGARPAGGSWGLGLVTGAEAGRGKGACHPWEPRIRRP